MLCWPVDPAVIYIDFYMYVFVYVMLEFVYDFNEKTMKLDFYQNTLFLYLKKQCGQKIPWI